MLTNYLKKGRDPGWIELFFDLSYVVMLGRLSHILFHTHHGIIEWIDIFNFFWIFQLAFVIWMYFTVYMNIYGNDSDGQNHMSFVLMTGLFAIVLFMHDIEHLSVPIALTIGGMSLYLSLIYRRVKDRIPENAGYAEFKSRSLLVMAIAILPIVIMPHIMGMIYVVVVLVVEHGFDELIVNRNQAAPPDGKHFIERIGIFMIILFGENFITLVYNLPDHMVFEDYAIAGMMLLMIFSLWLNYFAYLEELMEVKYHRYSQILLTNVYVMLGLTILSAIIYHGLERSLDLTYYKAMIVIFQILFFSGNGITYFRSGAHSRLNSIFYAIVPVILVSSILFMNLNYLGVVGVFFAVNALTGLFISIDLRKERHS